MNRTDSVRPSVQSRNLVVVIVFEAVTHAPWGAPTRMKKIGVGIGVGVDIELESRLRSRPRNRRRGSVAVESIFGTVTHAPLGRTYAHEKGVGRQACKAELVQPTAQAPAAPKPWVWEDLGSSPEKAN
jgi:hypothetical protein